MFRAKVDELAIKERELERAERQHSYSSDGSDLSNGDDSSEETKNTSTVVMGSSFDNSANNRSRMSNENPSQNKRASMTN